MRITFVAVAAAALAACSSSNLPPPKPLPPNPGKIHFHRDWSVGVGGGGGELLLGLAPDTDKGLVVAASAGGHVVAVDAKTGHIKWQRYLKAHLAGGPGIGSGEVAVGTRSGDVIELDAETGKTQWKHYVGAPVISTPAFGDGVVVVNTLAGDFMGLDTESGDEKWKQSTQGAPLSLRMTTHPMIVDGVAYCGFSNGRAMAVDIDSGKQVWAKQIASGQTGNLIGDMVDVGRQMSYAGGDLYVATYQGRLEALVAESGQVAWSRDLSSFTGVTLDASRLYSSDATGRVHAFDLVTGVPDWTYPDLGYRSLSAPTSYHGMVVVGDRFGYLHFIDRKTGHYLGRISMDDGAIRMKPIVVGDRLIVLGGGGELAAYQVTMKSRHGH